MTPLDNQGPRLEKNYVLAFVLSMAVLLGYPYFLRWASPPQPTTETEQETPLKSEKRKAENLVAESAPVLQPAEGPFLEKTVPPALIQFKNNFYEIDFSTLGASISRLVYAENSAHNNLAGSVLYQGDISAPGLFAVRFVNEDSDLSVTPFKLNRSGNNLFDFVYEKPGEYRLVKRFRFDPSAPLITLELLIDNLSSREKHFTAEIDTPLYYEHSDAAQKPFVEAMVLADKMESAKADKIEKKGFMISKPALWSGVVRKYFAILIRPETSATAFNAKADGVVLTGSLRLEPMSVMASGKAVVRFVAYAGAQKYETLKATGLGFEEILSRGFFGIFKLWLLIALKFLFQYTHNFGWAIILMTIFLKGVFTPLTHLSFESMKKMQVLQPKLKALQERYKNDAAKLNKEMMELYKRNRVNPMMGCMPMVLQIPIFIAFYHVLNETVELSGAPFIGWITDLSQPDRLFAFPVSIPFLGDSLHLLPFLMIASMVWQQKLTPQAGATPEQTKMMSFMPLIFGFLFYKMPSGLVLYWFVNNVLSIIHQIFVKRMVIVLHHEDRD